MQGRYSLFTFRQAGLVIHRLNLPKFVWEEDLEVLGMPHFYLGTFIYTLRSYENIRFLAFFILGIGIGFSTILFICEHLFKHLLK